MGAVSKTCATLRIIGDDLEPASITELLGKEPTYATAKGVEEQRPGGRSCLTSIGIWNLRAVEAEPGNLDSQISALLDQVSSDMSVWKNLASRFRCEIFCGLFLESCNEGISLSQTTLALLAERKLEIGFDIYGSSKGDNPDGV